MFQCSMQGELAYLPVWESNLTTLRIDARGRNHVNSTSPQPSKEVFERCPRDTIVRLARL